MSDHLNDSRLLEWLLNPAGRNESTRAELDSNLDARLRLDQLSGFLEHCRTLAEDVTGEATSTDAGSSDDLAPLTARVLDRTTREDLTWRGDLALYGRYLRVRLAESGWFRLAAASLLLHMIALPALAVYLLVSEPKAPEIGFIPWDQYYPEGFPEEVRGDPPPALEGPEGDPEDLEVPDDEGDH